jgi:hypothetical protein
MDADNARDKARIIRAHSKDAPKSISSGMTVVMLQRTTS